MRFYLDEDLSSEIASIARNLGVDVISSHDCGNNGKPDDVQLAFAAAHSHCILTNNRDHFLDLSLQYAARGELHAGVLLLSRSLATSDFVGIARALVRYAREHPADLYHHTDWLHPAPSDDV